jgi:ribosome biogenesis GTPase
MENTTLANREEKLWQHNRQNKALREAGGPARKAPKPDRVRSKDWTTVYTEDPDGYYDLDVVERERVMPKGEIESRYAKTPQSPLHSGLGLATLASNEPSSDTGTAGAETEPPAGQSRGTVVEVSSGLCRVALAGRRLLCVIRSSLRAPHSGFTNVVAAGDEVLVSHNGHERGMVEAVLPRRSALARPDVSYDHLQQVIVANVDQVLIVAAWRQPAFWPELVDRYLIAAVRNNLASVICINKTDLVDDPAELAATVAAYEATGCRVLCTSALAGQGLDALRDILAGRTTALAGLSGVGKSSLLSAVEPDLQLRVSEVSDRRHEGRHITTQVTLHPLAGGGFVADTPGIREFGLSGLRQPELARFYPEISAEGGACAYANCSHTCEPGCAVKVAVRAGRISRMRYDSYRKIHRDLPD